MEESLNSTNKDQIQIVYESISQQETHWQQHESLIKKTCQILVNYSVRLASFLCFSSL